MDADLGVWLIEVNCSPSLEHSTPITSQMVREVCHDTIKVRKQTDYFAFDSIC